MADDSKSARRLSLPPPADKGGASRKQGEIAGIKAYAALLGGKEEAARKSQALADLHAIDPTMEAKARRDFSEVARSRVLEAAERHVEAKERRIALEAGETSEGGAARDAPGAAPEDIDTLFRQSRALLDAGLGEEARQVQAQLAQARAQQERERLELEQRLVSQRLARLEAEQQEQRDALARSQQAEREQAERVMRDEIAALLAQQAAEVRLRPANRCMPRAI